MTWNVGVAGIPGAWSTERLALALTTAGARAPLFDLAKATVDVEQRTVHCDGVDLTAMDALVVKKLGPADDPRTAGRTAILEALELAGVRVFSPAASIAHAIDRVRMTLTLEAAHIPIPTTVITGSLDEAEAAVERLGAVVLKPIFTSKGRGMLLLDHQSPVRLRLRAAQRPGEPFYLQRFVATGGKDIGVAVVGDQPVGAYARVAGSSWLTTTTAGGSYEAYPLDWTLADLAVRAARAFHMDYTVVDIAISQEGPLVYEVSAFGGFRGLWEARGIDVAALYAGHVLSWLGERRRARVS